jgi:hypothetical protein
MSVHPISRTAGRLAAIAAAMSVGAYAACVVTAWRGYGRPSPPDPGERDELLDQFMPDYDVVERHRITVDAPAAVVLTAAKEQDLMASPFVRAIFKAREVVLGASSRDRLPRCGLLATVRGLGWGELAERPGREIVVGAVTRPWEADVTFRAISPDRFAAYREPGDVKIVWTLRADPIGAHRSIFTTETRAVATDAAARARFRTYWAFASPGISAIRWLSLRPLQEDAERRARELEEER